MEWLKLARGTTAEPPPVALKPGDEVRVWFKILEQGKERLGQFEGTVIRLRGPGSSKTFTVRRVTHGEGVERVFPVDAKSVARIEVLRQGDVRRSRLYFLRRAVGKTRITSRRTSASGEQPATEAPMTNKPVGPNAPPERPEGAVAAAT